MKAYSKQQTERFFSKNVHIYSAGKREKNSKAKKSFIRLYQRELYRGLDGRGNALDLGAGGGIYTFGLADFGFEKVYAVDISKRMLMHIAREAKGRGAGNIIGIVGDAENLPFPDDFFDVVISMGLMECIPDKKKALSEILRVLRPGGQARIRWLNREGLWGAFECLHRKIGLSSGPFSKNYSTYREAVTLCKSTGFSVEKVVGVVKFPTFIFPRPVSTIMDYILGLQVFKQKMRECSTEPEKIKSRYYSFLTLLGKAEPNLSRGPAQGKHM